jgi:hypothetical protein
VKPAFTPIHGVQNGPRFCCQQDHIDIETDMANTEKIIGLIIAGSLPCFKSNAS